MDIYHISQVLFSLLILLGGIALISKGYKYSKQHTRSNGQKFKMVICFLVGFLLTLAELSSLIRGISTLSK